MEEWKEYKLGEIIDFISGGTPNKNTPRFWNGDIPWISAKTMYVDFVSTSDLFITKEGLEAGSKLAPKGTILLLTRGSGLFNTIPICKVVSPVAFNQDVKCLYSRNEGIISNDFLFYWLKGNEQTITNILETTGIGAGKIDTKRFLDLPIKLPSLKEQEKLVEIASSLFEKIKTNNAINENLEQQAQALFKSWFVDFEPFRDQPFVESELGMIPEGWRVGTLSEIAEYSKSRISIKDIDTQTYVSTENMLANKQGITEASGLPNVENVTRFEKGDVLISNIRPYFKKLNYCNHIGGCSGDVMCFHPLSKEYRGYLYCSLYDDVFFDYVMSGTKGTKMPRGDKRQIMNYRIFIPSHSIIDKFNRFILSLLSMIDNNRKESHRLSHLRDTLLPKLMSGEIKL